MSQSAQTAYGLGKTAAASELAHLLGQRGLFLDKAWGDVGVVGDNTGMFVEAQWVKNNGGTTLLAAEMAVWEDDAAAQVGTMVDATAGAASAAAGVVDPFLPSSQVATLRHFWLIVKGPTQVIHAGNDTIVAGDGLVTAAAGRADLYDGTATAASEVTSRFGRAITTPADNVAGTKFRALVDFRY